MLGGPANELVAEKGGGGDFAPDRAKRVRLKSTRDFKPTVTAAQGPLALTVEVAGDFIGGPCRRLIRFYKDSPRIDFMTELNDLPDLTIVMAEFPLAEPPREIRRGVPYGFSYGTWDPAAKPGWTKSIRAVKFTKDHQVDPTRPGWTEGVVPAVRWSDYAMAGGAGLAILDRGLSGREILGKTPMIYLYNAADKYNGYPCAWLSGKGKHRVEYAIVAHEGAWKQARIPQMAWEFNAPPAVVEGCAAAPARSARSFIKTSHNVLVEAVRREGNEIEIRMAECFGQAGQAEVTVNLPHEGAALTNMLGGEPQKLSGGPAYTFAVRPQQIVTMRLKTTGSVAPVQTLTQWDEFVPPAKQEALHHYAQVKGHPPRGN